MSRPRLLLAAAAALQVLTLMAFAQVKGKFKQQEKPADAPPSAVAAMNLTLSGPFTHESLTIFLVHGPDAAPNARFLTLEEGLGSKKVRVIETGEVGELKIENLSSDEIYIESGE